MQEIVLKFVYRLVGRCASSSYRNAHDGCEWIRNFTYELQLDPGISRCLDNSIEVFPFGQSGQAGTLNWRRILATKRCDTLPSPRCRYTIVQADVREAAVRRGALPIRLPQRPRRHGDQSGLTRERSKSAGGSSVLSGESDPFRIQFSPKERSCAQNCRPLVRSREGWWVGSQQRQL